MEYIIYFDENYKKFVELELGKFIILGEGIGLYNAKDLSLNGNDFNKDTNLYSLDKIDKSKLNRKFYQLLNYYNIDLDNLTILDVLNNSIFVRFYHRVMFIQDKISETFLAQELSKYDKGTTVSVRVIFCSHNRYENLTQDIASKIENLGYKIDVKNPQIVISILANDKLYISIDLANELVSNYKAGAPHYAKGEEISRAEFKLLEALDRFRIDLKKTKTAIDLGASPGGWTHLLAQKGMFVTAVDPAKLDQKVTAMPNVKHIRMVSQDFLKNNFDKYDMIVNDMKMFGDKSAHIVCNCSNNLKNNAVLIMTIKLAKENLYEQILEALKILNSKFKIVAVKKLFHTRQEVIVYGNFKN